MSPDVANHKTLKASLAQEKLVSFNPLEGRVAVPPISVVVCGAVTLSNLIAVL